MNEDRLGPFTDYSSRRRPVFKRSVTIAAPEALSPDFSVIYPDFNINREASNFSSTPVHSGDRRDSKTRRSSKEHISQLASDLFNRRRGKKISKLQEIADTKKNQVPKRTRKNSKGGKVTFSEPPSKEHSPIPEYHKSSSSDPLVMPGSSEPFLRDRLQGRRSSPPINIPQTSKALLSVLEPGRPLSELRNNSGTTLMQLNPIVTPSRTDYSTILDDVDTSGATFGSPCGSPTTPRTPFFGSIDVVDLDRYTKKGSPEKDLNRYEHDNLTAAEENEHEQLESLIMKRMRQISLTESESLSDIAKHVIQELESDEDIIHGATQPDYHSDEEVPIHLRTDSEDDQLPLITKTNSEPSLVRLGSSQDSDVLHQAKTKSSSVSPPNLGSVSSPEETVEIHKDKRETRC